MLRILLKKITFIHFQHDVVNNSHIMYTYLLFITFHSYLSHRLNEQSAKQFHLNIKMGLKFAFRCIQLTVYDWFLFATYILTCITSYYMNLLSSLHATIDSLSSFYTRMYSMIADHVKIKVFRFFFYC